MSPKAKRALRDALVKRIERELALLDKLDGDPDLEPALGAAENHPGVRDEPDQADWYAVQTHDDREDDGDDLEPSLGGGGTWTDAGLQYDLEEDRSDFEYGGDDEPTMGWSETCGQGPRVGTDILSYVSDPCDTGGGMLRFDGDGHQVARDMLRNLERRRPRSEHCNVTIIAPGVARVGRQP